MPLSSLCRLRLLAACGWPFGLELADNMGIGYGFQRGVFLLKTHYAEVYGLYNLCVCGFSVLTGFYGKACGGGGAHHRLGVAF